MRVEIHRKKGRRFWAFSWVLVAGTVSVIWWLQLHRPWLGERAVYGLPVNEGERSVETFSMLPVFLGTLSCLRKTAYFNRVVSFQGDFDRSTFRHFTHLEWCVYHGRDGLRRVAFSECPRLERVHLVNVDALVLRRCPSLKELHLLRCEGIKIDGLPPGVKVFRDGRVE